MSALSPDDSIGEPRKRLIPRCQVCDGFNSPSKNRLEYRVSTGWMHYRCHLNLVGALVQTYRMDIPFDTFGTRPGTGFEGVCCTLCHSDGLYPGDYYVPFLRNRHHFGRYAHATCVRRLFTANQLKVLDISPLLDYLTRSVAHITDRREDSER